MNRYLAIPCILSIIGFGAVYFADASQRNRTEDNKSMHETANRSLYSGTSKARTNEANNVKLLTSEDAKILLLDGWPTRGSHYRLSRAMPRRQLYANGFVQVDENSSDTPYFLGYLQLELNRFAPLTYAVSIDRVNHDIKIFDENCWQPYDAWQKKQIPQAKHASETDSLEELNAKRLTRNALSGGR